MTTLTWPTLTIANPESCTWTHGSNTQSSTSPFSGAVQTVELPGIRWKASFVMTDLSEADSALLEAFLVKLRGRAGRFYLHNFARPVPRGTIAGTPLVKGAAQTGTTLTIDGCTVGTTLLIGDYIGVNGELKMVVENATADGTGQMILTIEPPLRSSPPDNAAITTNKPTATFMLMSDDSKWTTRAPILTEIPVDCMEVW